MNNLIDHKVDINHFLSSNQIQESNLPEELQKMIKTYRELVQLTSKAEEKEKSKLVHQLAKLETEIYDELLEEFEDKLDNNILPDEPPSAQSKSKPVEQEPVSEASRYEKVLAQLYDKGKRERLDQLYLEALGLELDYSCHQIQAGNFLLQRSSYLLVRFNLTKLS